MKDRILLDHGSGGLAGQELVQKLFVDRLENPILSAMEDSAVVDVSLSRFAFSTDSYVVDPLFFSGGNIGHLAVHGTINDLAMRGAEPVCLSLALILEEGLLVEELVRVVEAIKSAVSKAGVPIVAGDTKVVPRGKADKIFINTTGVGRVAENVSISAANAQPGDCIILTGYMADHGITILTSRAGLMIEGGVCSDTQPLHGLVREVVERFPGAIHTLRDPTRGGVGTTLWEIAGSSQVGIEIDEVHIPLRPSVKAACEMMGLDPLYLANEGSCLMIVVPEQAEEILALARKRSEGKDAAIIGTVVESPKRRVTLRTVSGGSRIVEPLTGEPLPRIC